MYNKVILMGRITHDLELKTTPSGANVCSFSIAVDRRFQQKGEEKKSDFFNIVAWRQQADFVTRYFGKGRMILVEGELQTRSYTDKNGMNVRVTEVIADRTAPTAIMPLPFRTLHPQRRQTLRSSPRPHRRQRLISAVPPAIPIRSKNPFT